MKTLIVPGLGVTGEMYEAASAGVAEQIPELAPLTWERFIDPSGWTLVPDDRGAAYKSELVLLRTAERTVKINLWSLPDRRGEERAHPHNHPWAFRAHVLLGGYDEDRYVPEGGRVVPELSVGHGSGGLNDVALDVYHEVTAIHEPDQTLTLMVCGTGRKGQWGYLDTDTGEHVVTEPDPTFLERLRAINPHKG
ncbi:hypothetical protein AB0N81_41750 [Streptomyces sp. NPDC093510]|uniref:hypothetical protein n=1 Tax=Streptomyces sp. NPDC093510 TaxID=3155199 RepID=UPI00341A5031